MQMESVSLVAVMTVALSIMHRIDFPLIQVIPKCSKISTKFGQPIYRLKALDSIHLRNERFDLNF